MDLNKNSTPKFRTIAIMANSPLYRNSFFMAFSNILNAGCGFLFWIIAARLYTVEQIGLASALISSLGLVLLFSRLGFDFSIIRFISLENKGMVIGTSLIITTTACILAGLISFLLLDFFSPSMCLLKVPLFSLAFLMIGAVNSAANVTGYTFIADRRSDQYFLQNLCMALRIPVLLPLTFLGTFGIFGSLGLGYLVASFFGLVTIQNSTAAIQLDVDREFLSKSFKFSFWNYLSSILSIAPTLIIPIMLLNMLGEVEAAKYYIAFAIGNLVLIIPNSFGTSLFVEGSHGEGLKKSVQRAGNACLALMLPAILILFFFGYRLLELIRAEYIEGFDLLRIIALSSFFVAVYSLFIPIQNVRMKVKSVMKLNALRCMLLLVLSYMLIQRYGILGVGYGWMITYIIIDIVIFGIAKKEKWI